MLYALFDVESRIDKSLIRRSLRPGLADNPAGDQAAFEEETALLRERQGVAAHELPWFSLQWHVPISVSVGVVDASDHTLGDVETILADELPGTAIHYEREIITSFWKRAEAFRQRKGVFVSFNGRGFDWPLLELHALKHGAPMPFHLSDKYGVRYRFGADAHIDLLEFMTNYGAVYPPKGGLGFYLEFLGYAGKGEVKGGDVQSLYEAGQLDTIQRYNRNDIRRLYQLFVHVQACRGMLDSPKAVELARAVKMEPE